MEKVALMTNGHLLATPSASGVRSARGSAYFTSPSAFSASCTLGRPPTRPI
jgi:hypothetical protein